MVKDLLARIGQSTPGGKVKGKAATASLLL